MSYVSVEWLIITFYNVMKSSICECFQRSLKIYHYYYSCAYYSLTIQFNFSHCLCNKNTTGNAQVLKTVHHPYISLSSFSVYENIDVMETLKLNPTFELQLIVPLPQLRN